MFYRVVGKSMEPEYGDGSVVLISKSAVKFWLRKGDVVMALDPRDGKPILKRIIKVSGEGIFVAGDNSLESTDSRTFGLIQKENIIGKIMIKFPQGVTGWLKRAVPVLASVGLVDAIYLTLRHFEDGEVECGIIPGVNCNLVLGSVYSQIFGIPLALLGVLYYLTVLIIGMIYLKKRDNMLLQLLFGVTCIGFLVSLYLVFIQVFVLNAYCTFCIMSASISIMLFASLLVITFSKDRKPVA